MRKRAAIWGMDYDMHNDKCYDRPVCPDCKEPFGVFEDGTYRCYACGEVVSIEDPEMIKWFEDRAGTKTEIMDCFTCGGKECVEARMRKNPVTLDWETTGGQCSNCGMQFIV